MPAFKAPATTITAVGSNHKITFNKIGTPAIFIFHGRNSVDASEKINGPVREKIPEASRLLVATVMDLHIAPRLMRGVVEAFLKSVYEDAAKKLPKGWKPYDYLILLPDWDSSIARSFGLKDTDHNPAIAAVDKNGIVQATYQGKDLVTQAMAMLDKIMAEKSQ